MTTRAFLFLLFLCSGCATLRSVFDEPPKQTCVRDGQPVSCSKLVKVPHG